jgi:tetratricopeptide (TPR) repeat protein
MKLAIILALIVMPALGEAGQNTRPAPVAVQPDPVAEAYAQFMLAHRLESADDLDGAIAAYKRAMTLDPKAAEIVSDLADFYLRQNRMQDAATTAEQALKISSTNFQAHRVLGTVFASLATSVQGQRPNRDQQRENIAKAIEHLEQAFDGPISRADANLRAMLARMYVGSGNYDKAIPVLADLVRQEPQWQDGVTLLVEAYSAAGRGGEAVRWLEEAAKDNPQLFATLADLYARDRRWRDAANAYELAIQASIEAGSRGGTSLRVGYAQALLNLGGKDDIAKARNTLREAVAARATDEALYWLSQAERRMGDLDAAEGAARKLVAQNARNVRGYVALAEALEERRRYQAVVDAIAPALSNFRQGQNSAFSLSLLLPHLGFAYQQVGQHDKAVATFEEARKLAPDDPTLTGYLIQAYLAAKNYVAAAELARQARTSRPDNLGLARLEAEALRQSGRADQGVALLEGVVKNNANDPDAYIALSQLYADANRGAQAVKVLQDAQMKFPAESSLTFQLAAVLERQKKFAESEAVFRQLIAKEPEHAAALNYLGYMLADRGEKLDESVGLIRRALEIEPDNGSYLDSLGWAYFKIGKLDLAEQHLKRAADQMVTNSVVQDHYGDVLARLGRFEQAIEAWNRALVGDGDSIDRGDIDRKIRSARQKLPRR